MHIGVSYTKMIVLLGEESAFENANHVYGYWKRCILLYVQWNRSCTNLFKTEIESNTYGIVANLLRLNSIILVQIATMVFDLIIIVVPIEW